jgi:hypothetical protein
MSLGQLRSTICLVAVAMLAMSVSRGVLAGTCGDYLQHTTAAATAPIASHSLPLTPKPCNGPTCSQAPSQPASVPVTAPSAPDQTRNSIVLLHIETQTLANLAYWLDVPNSAYLYVAAEDIFHPPRVA